MVRRLSCLVTAAALAAFALLLSPGSTVPPPLPPRPSNGSIPCIVHQTWKGRSVPHWAAPYVGTWKKRNAGCRYKLWTDDDARSFVSLHFSWLLEMYDSARPIERADIFRYLVLEVEGGYYADLDVACLVPVSEWSARYGASSSEVDFVAGLEAVAPAGSLDWHRMFARRFQVVQWAMASAPGHPILRDVIRRIHGYYLREGSAGFSRDVNVMETTGPGVWSDAVARFVSEVHGVSFGKPPFGPDDMKMRGARFGGLLLFPVRSFGHHMSNDLQPCLLSDRLVQHYFQGSWKADNAGHASAGGVTAADAFSSRLGFHPMVQTVAPPFGYRRTDLYSGAAWVLAESRTTVQGCAAHCDDRAPRCTGFVITSEGSASIRARGQCHLAEGEGGRAEPRRHVWARRPGLRIRGFREHPPGYWANHGDGNALLPAGSGNMTVEQCGDACRSAARCRGFEVFAADGGAGRCYLFPDALAAPFTPNPSCRTYVLDDTPTPRGYRRRSVDGYWKNHGAAAASPVTTAECAEMCDRADECIGFEVFVERNLTGPCYLFVGSFQYPFTPEVSCRTFVRARTLNTPSQ